MNDATKTKLVAGNRKMNGLREDGAALAHGLVQRVNAAGGGAPACELLICPPATLLTTVGSVLAGSGIALGGQDCHAAPKGAHTGDISAEMLADMGCSHVILGHSERRHGHGEGDAMVREKIVGAWRAGLAAILCVGETRFAVEVFCNRVGRHIASLAAALGGLDGIVFTAGVGENAAAVRSGSPARVPGWGLSWTKRLTANTGSASARRAAA